MGAGEDGFEAVEEGCFAVVFGEDFYGEAFVLEAGWRWRGYRGISGEQYGFYVVEKMRAFEAITIEFLLDEGSVEVGESFCSVVLGSRLDRGGGCRRGRMVGPLRRTSSAASC